MSVKVLMSWDIMPEREQEYFEFIVREFLPGAQALGLELTDAWATAFGAQPQILVGANAGDFENAKRIMTSTDWDSLQNKLNDYVLNFSFKIVRSTGGFQF